MRTKITKEIIENIIIDYNIGIPIIKIEEKYKISSKTIRKILINNNIKLRTREKGFNRYKINGEETIIYLEKRDGKFDETIIDTEDLQKLIKLNVCWHSRFNPNTQSNYAQASNRFKGDNGKMKGGTLSLQRIIMNVNDKKLYVDHENHDTLDNRKYNLRVTINRKNLSHRQGANSNSQTGVRNVNFGWDRKYYNVAFMKEGKPYIWEFPLSKFQEACAFADIKRKEIFGEFAGNA